MDSSQFLKKMNDKLESLDRKEIIKVVNNIARKIPKSKYEEVMAILEENDKLENIESRMEEYKEKLNMIADLELYFHATGQKIMKIIIGENGFGNIVMMIRLEK